MISIIQNIIDAFPADPHFQTLLLMLILLNMLGGRK